MFVHYVCICLFLISTSLNICGRLQHCVSACSCESMCSSLHVLIHHFLQDCVTIFQLTCRSGAWSLVPAFQNDKVYLSVFWYAQRKLGLTAWGGRKRGATTTSPPHDTKCHPSPGCGTPSHPAEKSRHLKLCDMCHRHCHWASATDGAGIDRPRATGAGWGTHRVWCVSLPILVRDASQAATPTQTALWVGRGEPPRVDICLTCAFVHARGWMGCLASQTVD